jgi:alanyl-tRNA synthetase
VLGEGVQQKGSLVDPEKLRFDFSHGKSLTEEELTRVETLVSQQIEKALTVYAENAPQEQALKINGLRAVFGEKYPPMVRVVSIGVPVADLLKDPANSRWREHSIEFCGGTHLKKSSEAEGFVILAEESVSKGIRRILALTGDGARDARAVGGRLDQLIESAKKTAEGDVSQPIAEVNKLLASPNIPLRAKRRGQAALVELQTRQKAWEKTQRQTSSSVDAVALAGEFLSRAPDLGGGKLIVGEIAGASDDQLRSAIDSLKKKAQSVAIMLAAANEGKISFVSAVSDDLIAKGLKAGDWIRETAKVAGGGGGGRPQMAQAGGKDPSKIGEALETARQFAVDKVK